jgi:crotonobetaine/carnitine-CoA ligase
MNKPASPLAIGHPCIRELLERNATSRPDDVLVTFEDGSRWTNRQACMEAHRAGRVMHRHGLAQDQLVAVLLGNGPDFLRAWWGANMLGAVVALINPGYRGAILDRFLALAGPALAVGHGETGQGEIESARVPYLPAESLAHGPDEPVALEHPIQPWDLHSILSTSGTTGGSKAVLQSHHGLHTTGKWATIDVGLGPEDTLLVDLPLFHAGLNSFVVGCLATGTRLAVRSRPNLREYWDVIRETGATMAVGLSATAALLAARPPSAGDRDHALRYWMGVPLPPEPDAFAERFGIRDGLLGAYGCTEIGVCVTARSGTGLPEGSCGRVRPGFEVRIVDEHDIEVPAGTTGELILRTDQPWSISHGYLADPEATSAAWRNGWFHTGDALHVDGHGHFFFRDRIKDVVRRRGENIATFEVEAELAQHPSVREVACIGVTSDEGVEEELHALVIPEQDGALDFAVLAEWAGTRLPRFMVPRFFSEHTEFPRTPTGRVQKFLLRAEAPAGPVWDRNDHLHAVRVGAHGPTEGAS